MKPLTITVFAVILNLLLVFSSGLPHYQRSAPPQAPPPIKKTVQAVTYSVEPIPVSNQDWGFYWLSKYGMADQYSCLIELWNGESGWRVEAYNPSGATGIPQALPGSKMAVFGDDYLTNPSVQTHWGVDYIQKNYSTPCHALSVWQSRSPHWY